MALQRANAQDVQTDAPVATDFGDNAPPADNAEHNGFDNAPQAPVAATNSAATNNAAAKPKTQDTYIKVAFTEGSKEIWMKQTKIHENGVREFADTRAGYTAYLHPRDAFAYVYKTADAQNYMLGFRDPKQKNGVVARIFVSVGKTSQKQYVGCKYQEDGLFGADGKAKATASMVFPKIVGKEAAEITELLKVNGERLFNKAPPAPAQNQPAESVPAPSTPENKPAMVPGQDIDFGVENFGM